jgi:hypothetical protein
MSTVTKTKTKKKPEPAIKDPFAKSRIEIPEVHMDIFRCRLIGETPLIIHAMGEKKRKEMRDLMGPKTAATKVRPPKDQAGDYFDSMYILNNKMDKNGKRPNPHHNDQEYSYEGIFTPLAFEDATAVHGVRASGFRLGMVRAAKSCGAVMTDARCNMKVESPFGDCVPITFETVVSREDPVKVGKNQTDLRYRPMYEGWSVDIQIVHMSDVIGPEQIIQLLRIAGRVVGVGEWRNEKGGEFGGYDVDLNSVELEKKTL